MTNGLRVTTSFKATTPALSSFAITRLGSRTKWGSWGVDITCRAILWSLMCVYKCECLFVVVVVVVVVMGGGGLLQLWGESWYNHLLVVWLEFSVGFHSHILIKTHQVYFVLCSLIGLQASHCFSLYSLPNIHTIPFLPMCPVLFPCGYVLLNVHTHSHTWWFPNLATHLLPKVWALLWQLSCLQ